ncbi:type II secretion system protein N [Shewanella aestuarii]|uniref:Type II secretion system protein N n=1 Tax=Shewanella aestuarii TaxID=1028752 RepID=A0A6G9QGH1_9GAMM|nr:type II secretion system protein N [Shewanella aestuarii]QIR13165.1 type II secretion system protein N [Shewanella aestuarii]
MKLFVKIGIAVLLYLFFLVAYLPANWLVSIAPLPSNVSLAGVDGTLWDGQADLVKIDNRQLENVSWQLSPLGLFLGQANVDFQIGNRATAVSGRGSVSYSLSGLSAENVRFEAPNSFILAGTRLPFRTQISGDVSLMVQTLEQGQPWCEQLNGKLFLNSTNVTNQFGEYPLGDVVLGLSCIDGQVQLNTDEQTNQLGLQGTLILAEKNLVKISAKIKPTDSQPDDLRKALSFLGKQDSQGYYPINYQGTLPGL